MLLAMRFEDIQAQISDIIDFGIEDMTLLGKGTDHTAYVVNDAWVFRFAQTDNAQQTLMKEIDVLPVLEAAVTVKIPVFVYSHVVNDGLPFGGYRLLPGEAMTRERFNKLEPHVQQRLFQELYDFLMSLHGVDPAKVPVLKEEALVGVYNQTQRHFHDRLSQLIESEVVHKIEAVFMAYEANLANLSTGLAVIHSDLKPAHVLFDANEGHLTGVLDWGDVALGDPDYDFAVVNEFFGADFLGRLLDCGSVVDKERILRKVPFLLLVRALQDLTLDVARHNEETIASALHNVLSKLSFFRSDGTYTG
jgi:aminoglycoside 2''-phosphotransferase